VVQISWATSCYIHYKQLTRFRTLKLQAIPCDEQPNQNLKL